MTLFCCLLFICVRVLFSLLIYSPLTNLSSDSVTSRREQKSRTEQIWRCTEEKTFNVHTVRSSSCLALLFISSSIRVQHYRYADVSQISLIMVSAGCGVRNTPSADELIPLHISIKMLPLCDPAYVVYL